MQILIRDVYITVFGTYEPSPSQQNALNSQCIRAPDNVELSYLHVHPRYIFGNCK